MSDARLDKPQALPSVEQSEQKTTNSGLNHGTQEQPRSVNRIDLTADALKWMWSLWKPKQYARTAEQSLARGIWYLAVATWTLVIVVVILAMGGDQDVLKDTRRAWIVPRGAAFDEPPIEGKAAKIKISFDNTGFEPAFDVNFTWDYFVIASERRLGDANSRKTIENANICNRASKLIDTRTAYPSGAASGPVYDAYAELDGEHVTGKIISGDQSLVLYGCFLYKAGDEIRQSAYCYYSDDPARAFNLCPFGNEGT
jgi:hypothetical protein